MDQHLARRQAFCLVDSVQASWLQPKPWSHSTTSNGDSLWTTLRSELEEAYNNMEMAAKKPLGRRPERLLVFSFIQFACRGLCLS